MYIEPRTALKRYKCIVEFQLLLVVYISSLSVYVLLMSVGLT